MINPWRDLKGLPKEMWFVTVTVFINRAGTMFLPFLMLYLTKSLHLPPQKASLALVAHGIGALITTPIAGRVADSVGAARVMKVSLLLSGMVLFFFPFINNFYLIIATIFIWSITGEAFRPACLAIVTELVPTEQLKPAFALNRLAINLGMSIGPALGGFLVYFSFNFIFIIDGLSSLLAGVFLLIFLNNTNKITYEAQEQTIAQNLAPSLPPIKNTLFIYFLLALCPTIIIFFQLESTTPLFLVRDLKLPEAIFGLLYTINTIIIVLMEIPLNSITNKWPYSRSLGLGCLLTGLGFGAMFFVTGAFSAIVPMIILTFGEMILFPAGSAYVSEVSPANRKGQYMGIYSMSFGIGAILGPLLGTNILENFGASTLWIVSLMLGMLSFFLMFFIKTVKAKRADT